ncbi:Hypp6515 [Branchiostoma lanceolatum]|uniref:Hypp6515 protein n=1 Tax=Branchiostoma lanceolatum TaxID=7740 RepID=A0A8J9YV47_BRALA|nr:Hypp6515 [Branchiostoma lanceolatum]
MSIQNQTDFGKGRDETVLSCTSFVEAQKESMALMYTFREEQGRLKSKVNLDASGQSTINSSDLQVLDFAFQDFDSPQPSFCMEDSDLNDLGVMPLSKDTNTTAITDVLSAIIKFLTALLSQTILKQNTRERFVMTVSRGVDWIDLQRRASVQQREIFSQRKVGLYVGLQDDSHQLTRYYPGHPCHSYCLDHPRHLPPARIDDEELVDDPRDSLASDVIAMVEGMKGSGKKSEEAKVDAASSKLTHLKGTGPVEIELGKSDNLCITSHLSGKLIHRKKALRAKQSYDKKLKEKL